MVACTKINSIKRLSLLTWLSSKCFDKTEIMAALKIYENKITLSNFIVVAQNPSQNEQPLVFRLRSH